MKVMEGAVLCVGTPYILKLCKNVIDPWLSGKLSLCFAFLESFITSSK